MAIPYKPKMTENEDTSSTEQDPPENNPAVEPADQSQQGDDTTDAAATAGTTSDSQEPTVPAGAAATARSTSDSQESTVPTGAAATAISEAKSQATSEVVPGVESQATSEINPGVGSPATSEVVESPVTYDTDQGMSALQEESPRQRNKSAIQPTGPDIRSKMGSVTPSLNCAVPSKVTATESLESAAHLTDSFTPSEDSNVLSVDAAAESKKPTVQATDSVTQLADLASQSKAANVLSAVPSADKTDKSMDWSPQYIGSTYQTLSHPPPGFKIFPRMTWPLSDKLWPWATGGRARSETLSPGFLTSGVQSRLEFDPGRQPEVSSCHLISEPKGGARPKVRSGVEMKRKAKSRQEISATQNRTMLNDSSNGPGSLSTKTAGDVLRPEASTLKDSTTLHQMFILDNDFIKSEINRLRRNRLSPTKLSAIVTKFHEQCAALCRTESSRWKHVPFLLQGDIREPSGRSEIHSGVWWRPELERKVRRRGRVGRWFELRYERGLVHCDPPPAAKYTGFSTARPSDFEALDPEVYPRGSVTLLGRQWASNARGNRKQPRRRTIAPPGDRRQTASATSEDRMRAAGDDSTLSRDRGGVGEDTSTASEDRGVCENASDGETFQEQMQRRVGTMEEITERCLQLGGSLADIINIVKSSQTAATDSGGDEVAGERDEVAGGVAEVAGGGVETAGEEIEAVCGGVEMSGKKAEASGGGAEASGEAIESSGKGAEASGGGDEILGAVQALAMELDDEQVFAGEGTAGALAVSPSNIDARMQRVRKKSEFIQREYARVKGEVDNIRQALPEMDKMFTSLQNISGAVLSGAKSRDLKTPNKTFPGGELRLPSAQLTKPSESKITQSAKKGKRGRAELQATTPPGGDSSAYPTQNPSCQPLTTAASTTSPDHSPSVEPKLKKSTSAENSPKLDTAEPHSETPKTKRNKKTPSAESAPSEYPCVVGRSKLRSVPGLPPPGIYIPQHRHLLLPAEQDVVEAETGEERLSVLDPIGRLAWVLPHRFMSSKQLMEVHNLLKDSDLQAPLDALTWVQESGANYIEAIHRFFQLGMDRRYLHVRLAGKPVALDKIHRCDMFHYLTKAQWRWPALVSPNTFVSSRGSGDGTSPNPYRTNGEILARMEAGALLRVSGITAYIRFVVCHVSDTLVCLLEKKQVSCAEEKDAVASMMTVLLHRWHEADKEPAGIVQVYSLHNDSMLEGEIRHMKQFVTLHCGKHFFPIGCRSWSCQLWLWLLHETCRLIVDGEHRFVQSQEEKTRLPTDGPPPPPYRSSTAGATLSDKTR